MYRIKIPFLLIWIFLFGWTSLVVNSSSKLCSFTIICAYNDFVDPIIYFSLFNLFVSLVFLFVKEATFLKWLRFAITWAVLTAIFVALAPTYSGGWMSFGPTKELVSIWMGVLLVLISVFIIWRSSKQNK